MPKLKSGTTVPTPEEDRVITAAAESDADNPPLVDLAGFKPARDLLERNRATGEGWQTRINDDLRKAADKQRSTR